MKNIKEIFNFMNIQYLTMLIKFKNTEMTNFLEK